MSRVLLVVSCWLLVGCNTIYNAADSVGSHLPTIGEPCRNWQCVTESGQRKSDEIKWLDEASEQQPARKTVPQPEKPTPPAQ